MANILILLPRGNHINMYRLIISSLVLVAVLAHPKDNKCRRFMHPGGLDCCKTEFSTMDPPEKIKECMGVPKKPPSCEHDICIANKLGFASTDGTIDKKAFLEMIQDAFDKNSDVVKLIKDKCVDGDISVYGPPDFCDVTKTKMCMDVQLVASCSEWDDQAECSGAKEAAEECVKTFST